MENQLTVTVKKNQHESSTVTVDNGRGSTRFFTIEGKKHSEKVNVEFDPGTGKAEINGQVLYPVQVMLLMEFLTQEQ